MVNGLAYLLFLGSNGYCGGKVIYIDTENTFRPDRLRPIAERFNLDQVQTKHGRILLFARHIYEKRTRNLKYVAKI